MNSEKLSVHLAGSVPSGKSSFLNAILGEGILPMSHSAAKQLCVR